MVRLFILTTLLACAGGLSLLPAPPTHRTIQRGLVRRCTSPLLAEDEEPAGELAEKGDSAGALAAIGATLEQAMGKMPVAEKYNAVLLTLCSTESSTDASAVELVEEMTSKRIGVTPRALKALLDAAVAEGSLTGILNALRAGRANGACRCFAAKQVRIASKPSPRDMKTLADVPSDSRTEEVTAATVFSAAVGLVIFWQVADIFDFILPGDTPAPPVQFFILALAAGWGVDRYGNRGEQGELISRGLTRLFERDLERESAVESASFLIGYLLGLPCCAFAPTAFKPIEMLELAGTQIEAALSGPGSPLSSARLVDRVLIWLMAPAAFESLNYEEMVLAQPSLGKTFIEAARGRSATLQVDVQQGGWTEEQDEARLKWAYDEAKTLVKRFANLREMLQEQMGSGVSAGDCVVLIEDQLKGAFV